jgi:hypothetical protein
MVINILKFSIRSERCYPKAFMSQTVNGQQEVDAYQGGD